MAAAFCGLGAALAALAAFAAHPDQARAADCPANSYRLFAGTLSISGGCTDPGEQFHVYCGAGNRVSVDYDINSVAYRHDATAFACSDPLRVFVSGNDADGKIDMSAVTPASGFTALTGPNLIEGNGGQDTIIGSAFGDDAQGGSGNDTLHLRDGVADTVDCGGGADVATVDRLSLDTVTNCETVNALPEPPPPPPVPTPAPANTAKPTLSGKPKSGKTLTCDAGSWTGTPSFAHAWLRNGEPIAGETATSLKLRKQDAGKAIQCEVTATGAGGTSVEQSKPVVPKKAKRKQKNKRAYRPQTARRS